MVFVVYHTDQDSFSRQAGIKPIMKPLKKLELLLKRVSNITGNISDYEA
jgi:hypothetical protein